MSFGGFGSGTGSGSAFGGNNSTAGGFGGFGSTNNNTGTSMARSPNPTSSLPFLTDTFYYSFWYKRDQPRGWLRRRSQHWWWPVRFWRNFYRLRLKHDQYVSPTSHLILASYKASSPGF
jgi:hypothetical protein